MPTLEETRIKIDSINKQLTALLEERTRLADDVVAAKIEAGLPIYDPTREEMILDSVASSVAPDMRNELRGTFEGIMNMSKLRQYKLRGKNSPLFAALTDALTNRVKPNPTIGCQGIDGSYTSEAARRMFPDGTLRFYEKWSDIFAAIEAGEVDYGVLPVENSTAGSVDDVYKLIMEHSLYIIKALPLHIAHSLIGVKGAKLGEIKSVISHPQALAQCKCYTEAHGFETQPSLNTAIAARDVAKAGDITTAAIAPRCCAEIYGLEALEEDIQDVGGNTTRFAAISKDMCITPDADKISIQFTLAHRHGKLSQVLQYFSALGLNLTKIQSLPLEGEGFEYKFYLDFQGTVRDKSTLSLISALSGDLSGFRFIGNYPEK